MKSGSQITTRSMFVRFSQVLGHNSPFKVNGKVILQVVLFPLLTIMRKMRSLKRIIRQHYLTLTTSGSIIPSTDLQFQRKQMLLSA